MIMQLIVAKYYYSWKVGEFLFLSHQTKVQTVKNVSCVGYVKNKPVEWRPHSSGGKSTCPTCHTLDTPLDVHDYTNLSCPIREMDSFIKKLYIVLSH